MSNINNNIKDLKINGNIGAISIGAESSATNYANMGTNEIQNLTDELLKILLQTKLNPQQKEEIKELVCETAKQVQTDKPKKITISSLIEGVSGIITIVNGTPQLIDAFTKWKTAIKLFIGS